MKKLTRRPTVGPEGDTSERWNNVQQRLTGKVTGRQWKPVHIGPSCCGYQRTGHRTDGETGEEKYGGRVGTLSEVGID